MRGDAGGRPWVTLLHHTHHSRARAALVALRSLRHFAALAHVTATHIATKATLRDLQSQGVAAHAVTRMLQARLDAKSRLLADDSKLVAAAQEQLTRLRDDARAWTVELQRLDACVTWCTSGAHRMRGTDVRRASCACGRLTSTNRPSLHAAPLPRIVSSQRRARRAGGPRTAAGAARAGNA